MVDNVINNLPFEFHLPARRGEKVSGGTFNDKASYSFCGPGTKFDQRVAEGYVGINHLDALCRAHDLSYSQFLGRDGRVEADRKLAAEAYNLALDSSHDMTERLYALLIAAYFGATASRFSLGIRRKLSFLLQHPAVSNEISSVSRGSSVSLLKKLTAIPRVRKEVLLSSRNYNEKYVFYKKHLLPLLSSSFNVKPKTVTFLSPVSSRYIVRRRYYRRKKTQRKKN